MRGLLAAQTGPLTWAVQGKTFTARKVANGLLPRIWTGVGIDLDSRPTLHIAPSSFWGADQVRSLTGLREQRGGHTLTSPHRRHAQPGAFSMLPNVPHMQAQTPSDIPFCFCGQGQPEEIGTVQTKVQDILLEGFW